MNTKVFPEKRYGGFTLTEIRDRMTWENNVTIRHVLAELLDEIEATHSTELLQRLRRIETKIHRVAVHTGAESDERVTATLTAEDYEDRIIVYVPGLDVTLSQLKRLLEERKIEPGSRLLFVVEGENLLATVKLTNRR